MEKSGELPIAEADTRWRANAIRLAVMDTFSKDRLWLFVTQNSETLKHEVLAANEFCHALDDVILTKLRKFCADFSGGDAVDPEEIPVDVETEPEAATCHATASR